MVIRFKNIFLGSSNYLHYPEMFSDFNSLLQCSFILVVYSRVLNPNAFGLTYFQFTDKKKWFSPSWFSLENDDMVIVGRCLAWNCGQILDVWN